MPRRPRVTRKILFYRLVGVDGDASRVVEPTAAFDRLSANVAEGQAKVVGWGEGAYLAIWLDTRVPPYKLRLGIIRQSGLPPKATTAGALSDLGLDEEEGLAEITHMVLFSGGIVGSEFNFYGPRPSSLVTFLNSEEEDGREHYELEPILRGDVQEQLRRLQDIRLFQLRTRPSYSTVLGTASPDLESATMAMLHAGEADELEVVFRSAKHSRKGIGQSLLEIARRIVGLRGFHENVTKFEVKGYDPATERVETIDVLHDRFVVERSLILQDQRSGLVDRASAYDAISNARRSLTAQLQYRPGA